MFHVLAAPPSAFGLAGPAPSQESASAPASTAKTDKMPVPSMTTPPLKVIKGVIGRQPVYNELVSCGVAPQEVLCLTRAFKGIFDFRRARPKDEYRVYLTARNELKKLSYRTNLLEQYIAVRSDDGGFRTYREEIPRQSRIISKTFIIENSLSQAVTTQGEGSALVSAFADIFSWDIDFYLDPRSGDCIKILFEKHYIDDQFVEYGRILAAQYIGDQKTYSAFFFDDGKRRGYYNEKGAPLRKMFIRVPVKFGMRTSSFSTRRFHPVTKRYRRHTGIDYGAPMGTPIFATAGGTVEFSGWKGGYGKLVILHHPNGYRSYYGHCSRLLVGKGTRVEQGQTIAKVGRTGQATGPHVHYEIRINNRPVDPNSIKTSNSPPLPMDQRGLFAQVVQDRLRIMDNLLLSQNHQ